jgi:hypothetical protein
LLKPASEQGSRTLVLGFITGCLGDFLKRASLPSAICALPEVGNPYHEANTGQPERLGDRAARL